MIIIMIVIVILNNINTNITTTTTTTTTTTGRTPLYYAALQNHLDCVVCLVSLEMGVHWLDVGDVKGR